MLKSIHILSTMHVVICIRSLLHLTTTQQTISCIHKTYFIHKGKQIDGNRRTNNNNNLQSN